MNQTTKIIVGILIALAIMLGGYLLFKGQNNDIPSPTSDSYKNESQNGSGVEDHFQRAVSHFGF